MAASSTQCQDCGNFPVPNGSPVAERMEALESALKDALDLLEGQGIALDYAERLLGCETCGGLGWIHAPEHACGGDERLCAEMCPQPVQLRCPNCRKPQRATPSDEEPF